MTPIFSRKKGEISKIEDSSFIQSVEDPPPLSLPSPVFEMDATKKSFRKKESLTKINSNKSQEDIVSPEFDNIWNSTNLMPQIEDKNITQLPTIGEEFSIPFEKSRTTLLGGKVAKINTEQTTQVSYNINKDLENLKKLAESDQKKKSKTKPDNKLEENYLLADEFKSGSSVFSNDKSNSSNEKNNRSLPI